MSKFKKTNKKKKSKKSNKTKQQNKQGMSTAVTAFKSMNISQPPKKMASNGAVQKVCALTDPFCGHAIGVRWPDGSLGTLPFTVRGHLAFSSFADGSHYVQFAPCFPYLSLSALGRTGSVFTLNSTYASVPVGGITSYISDYRPVCCGIVIRSLTPVMTTSGYIIVRRLPGFDGTLGAGVATGDTYATMTQTYPIVPGMEIPIVFSALSGSLARNLVSQSTTTTMPNNWDYIAVETVGAAASTTVLDFEFYYHFEGKLNESNQSLASLAPVSNNNSTALVSAATRVTGQIAKQTESTLARFGAKAVRFATEAVGTYLFGPTGGAVAGAGINAIMVD
jgi:hypothetical protein